MTTGVNKTEVNHTANAHAHLADSVRKEVQMICQRAEQLSAESKSNMTIELAKAAKFFEEKVGKGVVQDLIDMSELMLTASSNQVAADEENARIGRTGIDL
ncbi:hypothetical protein [Amycolatopsis sp. cmx-4-54]|uniref:hypothetical protein n=1 Tax=Amycolatopsis sp. cmx-4-54 TaxID=2790936 RepID=UPI0039790268